MSFLKNQMQDNLMQPTMREAKTLTTVGKVISSDEVNNTCSVLYVDRNGKKRNKDNVVVRLYDNGTGYFPAVGDFVEIQLERDICVIIARHISNYNMDVRSKMALQQDVFSDNIGSDPGASII